MTKVQKNYCNTLENLFIKCETLGIRTLADLKQNAVLYNQIFSGVRDVITEIVFHGNALKLDLIRKQYGYTRNDFLSDICYHLITENGRQGQHRISRIEMVMNQPADKRINYLLKLVNNCIRDQIRSIMNHQTVGSIEQDSSVTYSDSVTDFSDEMMAVVLELADKPSELLAWLSASLYGYKPREISAQAKKIGSGEKLLVHYLVVSSQDYKYLPECVLSRLKLNEGEIKTDSDSISRAKFNANKRVRKIGLRLFPEFGNKPAA